MFKVAHRVMANFPVFEAPVIQAPEWITPMATAEIPDGVTGPRSMFYTEDRSRCAVVVRDGATDAGIFHRDPRYRYLGKVEYDPNGVSNTKGQRRWLTDADFE